jgi:molybdopterin-guanine dinucleotide biosynthesis protein A
MLGIILCGGASSRMGRDKGLLPSASGTWAEMMLEKLEELGIPVAISVNRTQAGQYTTTFPNIELIADNDSLPLKGPLAAVLSVHVKYPSEDLLVAACDMPLMDPIVLKELYKNYQKDSGYEGYVFTNEGEPEPLCGIYKANGLKTIKIMYERGQLAKHSMKFMLDHLIICRIPIPENWKIFFKNFNTHADMNGL